MIINVLLTPAELPIATENGERVAIVIDVLRASTTICVAFSSGVQAILPSSSIEEARSIYNALPKSIRVLGGERKGIKQDGFDLGNSPLEYSPDKVEGKMVSFTSSNGTAALQFVREASTVYIGSFMNMQALSEFIADHHAERTEVTIICAGNNGTFSLEDACCAGGFAGYLSSYCSSAHLTDSAIAAECLFSNYCDNLLEFLQNTTHGIYLKDLGFSDDIECAADLNSLTVVPVMSGDSIISATKS